MGTTKKLPTVERLLQIKNTYRRDHGQRECDCSVCSLLAGIEARNGLLVRALAGHPPSREEIQSVLYPSAGPTTVAAPATDA